MSDDHPSMNSADHPTVFNSQDPESRRNRAQYEAIISSINSRRDPDSNTVLVVDDEVGIRRFVRRGIQRNDRSVNVYEAENGQDALDKLAEIREKYHKDPLFIVTDLNMPVMDGWTLIDTLYKAYKAEGKPTGIPIIVLSSTSGEKGIAFFRKSVLGDNHKYKPLVSVAKEACMAPAKYDARGEQGLKAWIKHFMRQA